MEVICDKYNKCNLLGQYCAHKEIHEHSENCLTKCGQSDNCACTVKIVRQIKIKKIDNESR